MTQLCDVVTKQIKIGTPHKKVNSQYHLLGLEAGCGSRYSVIGEEEKPAECVTVVRDTSIISNT